MKQRHAHRPDPTTDDHPFAGIRKHAWAAGLALAIWTLAAGCSESSSVPVDVTGTYKRELQASNGLHRVYTMDLRPDFSCTMTRDYVKRGVVKEAGTWTNVGRVVKLTLGSSKKASRASTPLEFKLDGNKLVPSKWDEDLFGVDGLGIFEKQ